jgi:hypothetical protein
MYIQETIEVFNHDWLTLATGVAIPPRFLTDCTTLGKMWAISRLAPPIILVNWPVTRFPTGGTPMTRYLILEQTRFCSDVMGL